MRSSFLCALAVAVAAVGLTAEPGRAAVQPSGSTVSEVPVNGTPHVLDGRVLSVVQAGNQLVLGGTFTQASNADDPTVLPRTGLLSFDRTTKQLSTVFAPQTDGWVNVVLPAADGNSVYVGGKFDTIGGVARKNLARVRLSDGLVMPTFDAAVAGEVRDLRLAGGRLWVAGAFTHIAGKAQPALATLWPASGAYHPYMKLKVAGTHNGGVTTVAKIDVNPQGDRLIALGNFATVAGAANRQVAMLNLSDGTAAAPSTWATQFYTATCASAFDAYVRDLDFSPDGSFFVVTTTGAYRGENSPCDSSARFETYAAGSNVTASWVNVTGGDTTYAVEITDTVVYTGGHARWQNNPFSSDTAGRGAVSREGIAALDPANGLPLSWNPTRERGVGVFDLLHTPDGLWVGSDTERIGADYLRPRIALLPSAGGASWEQLRTPDLPADVYVARPLGNQPDPVPVTRVNAGGPAVSATPVSWAQDSASNSPYHNSGLTRTTYAAVGSVDASVPAGTPSAIFSSEAASNSSQPSQSWNLAAPAGQELEVRLYFANRSTSTQSVGQRVFNVDLEGDRVLNNFDVVAAVGTNRGMMRNFTITSDGNIDLDLTRVTNYPMISAVEVVRLDQSPAPASNLVRRSFDGTSVGTDSDGAAGGPDWADVRGAFMLGGRLYTAHKDGSFSRRAFNGTTFGDAEAVNAQDELVVLSDWRSDIKSATSMFFDNGRVYFTVAGQNSLFYRYFTPASRVVGAKRLVAASNVPGIDFGQVRGAFVASSRLYFANRAGQLFSATWQSGAAAGTPSADAVQVSGPGIDEARWNARALFAYQGPTARFSVECSDVTCDFDATASTAPGSSVAGYAWDFGDGSAGTGATVQHAFAGPGSRTVTLTVTTASGQTASIANDVSTTQSNRAPVASFTASCDHLTCAVDAAGSTDPDGDETSYAWDFGDGASAAGPVASHEYATSGDYTITLTVGDGTLDDTDTRSVSPYYGDLQHVDAASTSGNRTAHSVTVPSTVQPGDALVLLLTTNSTAAVNDLAGWTLLQSRNGNGVSGRAWTRTATAGDAGSTVTVTTGALAKSVLSVSAYRSSAGAASVTGSAIGGADTAGTTHVTPTVAVTHGGSWLISYWAEKSADVPVWTLPDGATQRTTSAGTGSGKISAVLADSAAPVAPGSAGGLTATTSASVSRSVTFSLVVGLG